MKKITLLLLLCLTAVSWSYGQCTNPVYQYPGTTISLTALPGLQTIATNNWAQNEFSVLDGLVPGETYNVVTDIVTYITVTEDDGTTIIASGFDPVSFVATTSGIIIYWTLDAACADGPSTNILTQIECTTCICTATAAPDSINPTPADGDMTVQILPDGLDLLVAFDWDEAVLGNEGEYTISLGITAAGDDIGTIPFGGGNIIYTWTENTQYYWFITGTNCVGTTQSAIWTFTTATCAEIAAPACTTLISPTVDQLDVATAEAADMTREVNLSWNAISGALAYRLTFDGAELGNVTETDIDLFGLAYDTSYTWSIAPVNCFGVTTGCETRTFTTEQDPGLSVSQFESQLLSVFPNPVMDQLTIKTDLSIESVEIYNILGKQVKSISGDSILNNRVDMTSLLDGIYFLNITAEGKKQTIKVIKQ
ncbi:MAG: T9SS type A sorting domain-containing protein [Psychroserpens sp.]|uniref:T9SS type A sorting domain-containing protein n=1 Tax=Psychroserpens sp. TaxID=2020870 RepID=UPI0030029902